MGNTFENFFGMLTLKDKSYNDAVNIGFGGAALNFVIAAAAMALGSFWLPFNIPMLIGSVVGLFVMLLVGSFIGAFVFWIFAKMFGGTGSYRGYYNGYSHLALWMVLGIIGTRHHPVHGRNPDDARQPLGHRDERLADENHHKLPVGKAVSAVVIPCAIFLIVAMLIAASFIALLAAGGFGAMGGAMGGDLGALGMR